MDAQHRVKRIIAVIAVVITTSLTADAAVRTFGDMFNLPIPADQDQTRGWMQDAVINVTDHVLISDLDVEINITH